MRSIAREAQIKVLIADDDNQMSRRLSDFMIEHGFNVRTSNNGKDAREQILEWTPRFVLADLILPEGNALELIDYVKNEPQLRDYSVNVIVMSGHNLESNVKQSLSRGAKDYIVKPFRPEDLLKRLIFHSQKYRKISHLHSRELGTLDESGMMLHLTDLVLRQALEPDSLEDILFNLSRMVTMKVKGVRCSLVQCLNQRLGVVVTSNDDRKASGIQIDLYQYPEIIHVMNTGAMTAIENVEESVELRQIRARLKSVTFNSMIVCPVSRLGQPFGVLSLRMPPEKTVVSDNEIRFVEIVSHIVSLVMSSEVHKAKDNFWMKNDPKTLLAFPNKKQ
jgi:DNA-binding response OmpR family regulator